MSHSELLKARQCLRDKILTEGQNLGNGILKIDSILNHQFYPSVLLQVGKAFHESFQNTPIDRILTIEVSGIVPAAFTGLFFNVPVVYARKSRPITMSGTVYIESATKPYKGISR